MTCIVQETTPTRVRAEILLGDPDMLKYVHVHAPETQFPAQTTSICLSHSTTKPWQGIDACATCSLCIATARLPRVFTLPEDTGPGSCT